MRRWAKLTIAGAVSLAVLAGGAEIALRALVPNIIAGALRESLAIPSDHPVAVEMQGPAVWYALGGNIGNADVTIPHAEVAEGVTATLRFHADRVPFNVTGGDLRGGIASVYVSNSQLSPVISMLTSGVADSGRTRDGDIAVGRTIDAFGFSVPLEATLNVSVESGGIVRVVPKGLSAVGFDLDAEQLGAATGGLLEPLLSAHDVCVADQLPAGVTLTVIDVTPRGVEVEAKLADDFLSNPSQLEMGSCA